MATLSNILKSSTIQGVQGIQGISGGGVTTGKAIAMAMVFG